MSIVYSIFVSCHSFVVKNVVLGTVYETGLPFSFLNSIITKCCVYNYCMLKSDSVTWSSNQYTVNISFCQNMLVQTFTFPAMLVKHHFFRMQRICNREVGDRLNIIILFKFWYFGKIARSIIKTIFRESLPLLLLVLADQLYSFCVNMLEKLFFLGMKIFQIIYQLYSIIRSLLKLQIINKLQTQKVCSNSEFNKPILINSIIITKIRLDKHILK